MRVIVTAHLKGTDEVLAFDRRSLSNEDVIAIIGSGHAFFADPENAYYTFEDPTSEPIAGGPNDGATDGVLTFIPKASVLYVEVEVEHEEADRNGTANNEA